MVRVNAPEMVEAYVGEKLAGAAFWPPQVIRIPAAEDMQDIRTVRLVVTGSKANRYGGKEVPWRLASVQKE